MNELMVQEDVDLAVEMLLKKMSADEEASLSKPGPIWVSFYSFGGALPPSLGVLMDPF